MTARELRIWRAKNELTQEQAGMWAGSPRRHAARTWRRYELGERRVPRQVVMRIGHLKNGVLGRDARKILSRFAS